MNVNMILSFVFLFFLAMGLGLALGWAARWLVTDREDRMLRDEIDAMTRQIAKLRSHKASGPSDQI
jgi:NhaP-type Na+/H+ or K+/H+ antiporter